MKIPLLDLKAQDALVGAEVRAALEEVLGSQRFVLGPVVERFEASMASYCGVRYGVGVASGTDALALSLAALGVGPGTGVVVPAYGFFATASAVARLGGVPLFADIEPHTFNLDPVAVERLLEGECHPGPRGELRHRRRGCRVVGIVVVHLFGRLAAMAALCALAGRYGLFVLEDAAQAAGAWAEDGAGRRRAAGAFGVAGCLSFYPSKNLGGLGDGGMVLTDSEQIAARVRCEREHGAVGPYRHATLGLNSRLDALQAAALAVKLRYLDAWNARRREVARWYAAGFAAAGLARGASGDPLLLPAPAPQGQHVYHQFVVRTIRRDELRAHLDAAGIGTQVYYPLPLPFQPAFAGLGYRPGEFPASERASRESLALPMYPELQRSQVEAVVEEVARFFAR